MPRLPPSLFKQARSLSPQAPVLLPVCRDLATTCRELKWIWDYVVTTPSFIPPSLRFWHLCAKRGKGYPLQYVLGSQPFGELDIICRPGVLIPRPETEASTLHLASVIFSSNPAARALHFSPTQPIRILDLCTGTGCISLLLFARLCRAFPSLHIHGVDISPRAVSLARENLRRSRLLVPPSPSPPSSCAPPTTGKSPHSQTPLTFERADIFSPAWLSALTTPLAPGTAATAATQPRHAPPPPGGPPGGVFDILVSNPPYISAAGFARSTERSVRNFEPKIALVPSAPPPSPAPPGDAESGSGPACRPEDAFYARLLAVADRVGARVLLFEVADLAQAMRVVHMLLARRGPRDARRPGEKGKGDLNALEKGGLGPADTSRDWMVEIWRDEPGARESEDDHQPLASVRVCNKPVRIRGQGEGRSVFAHRSSHS